MFRRTKSFISFVLMLVLFVTSVLPFDFCYADETTEPTQQNSTAINFDWPEYPSIYAESGILIEASSGTILYEKNGYDQMYPASITKIMTALLALENGNLSDMIEFSHYDVYSLESGAAHVSMDEGELLSLNDCLYAIMLASANEVSNAVGEYVAKKQPAYTQKIADLQAAGNSSVDESIVAIEVFSDMMNARAVECGAKNTHFCNPNGLFNENHYTTCYDMAMITREAIKNDQFLKVESQLTYVLPTTNLKTETLPIANRHKMLFPLNSVYYEGSLGGKTGYVDQSGNTLVTFARRNGMTLISVVMKSNSENVYKDTKLLLDYGFNNFSLTNISQNENNFTPNSYSILGNSSSVFDSSLPLITINPDDYVVLPNGAPFLDACTSNITFTDDKSDIFATLEYRFGDRIVGSTTLTVNKDENEGFDFGPTIEEETKEKTTEKNYITINLWVVSGVIITILMILFLLYYLKKTQANRKRRRRRKTIHNNRRRRKLR